MKKYILVSFLLTFSFFIFNTSHAEAATLYYNAAVDTDWNTLGNWWEDDAFSVPASALPTVADDVVIEGSIISNSGPAASVNTMTINGALISTKIFTTVANGAVFNDTTDCWNCTIDGDAIFNNTSSINGGTVSGNAVFNDSAQNFDGTVSGDAVFNNESRNYENTFFGIVSGNAVFNDESYNSGTVSGNAVFNDESYNFYWKTVSGDATFNDSSYNGGTVAGNAIFTYASGGTISINNQPWGTINGTVKGGDDILITEYIFTGIGDIYGPIPGDAFLYGESRIQGGASVSGDAFFYDESYSMGTISGDAFFYDDSYNNGTVSTNADFYDSTTNQGAVVGDACFSLNADQDGGTVGGAVTVPCLGLVAPTVETSTDIFTINPSALVFFGSIVDTGGESAEEIGFEYGLDTSYGDTVSKTGDFVRGTFNVSASALACDTTYHYRAFAANPTGPLYAEVYGYGEDKTFTTGSCEPEQILYGVDAAGGNGDTLYTLDPGTGNILTSVGSIGYYITGLAFHPITGVLYGTSGSSGSNTRSLFTIDTTTGAGTYLGTIRDAGNTIRIMPDIAFRSDGRLYGGSSDGNIYTIDINSCDGGADTSCLATVVGDGGSNWGNGIAFDSSDNLYFFGNGDGEYAFLDPDTGTIIAEHSLSGADGGISIGAAKFNSNDILFAARTYGSSPADLVVVNLADDSIISMREDNPDMIYISAIAFSVASPFVLTSSVSAITQTGATLNGEIVNTGGANATIRGFEYGTTVGYGTIFSESNEPYGAGDFSTNLVSLVCGTTYHYRAFATNIVGTFYGEDLAFSTNACDVPAVSAISGSYPIRTSMNLGVLCPVGDKYSSTTGQPCTSFAEALTTPTCSITRTLMRSSTGDEVKCLQQGLNQRLNTNLVIDGIFGPLTQAAVIRFQLANSLKEDGIFGVLSKAVWNK